MHACVHALYSHVHVCMAVMVFDVDSIHVIMHTSLNSCISNTILQAFLVISRQLSAWGIFPLLSIGLYCMTSTMS